MTKYLHLGTIFLVLLSIIGILYIQTETFADFSTELPTHTNHPPKGFLPITKENAEQIRDLALFIHNGVRFVSWSSNAKTLSITDSEGVWLYDTPAFQNRPRLIQEQSVDLESGRQGITAVALSPDGRFLATASWGENVIHLWDTTSLEEIAVLEGHTAPIKALAFSPDGELLASGGGKFPLDGDNSIRLWSLNSKSQLAILRGHTDEIVALNFSPDSKMLVSSSMDGTGRLWNVESQSEMFVLEDEETRIIRSEFSLDGSLLASIGDRRPAVILWDSMTGTKSHTLELETVFDIALRPDGSLIATASRELIFWNARTGEKLSFEGEGSGNANGADCVAFSPDGALLVSGLGESIKSVSLWAADTRRYLLTLGYHQTPVESVMFNPSGTLIASISSDSVNLWGIP